MIIAQVTFGRDLYGLNNIRIPSSTRPVMFTQNKYNAFETLNFPFYKNGNVVLFA